MTVETRTLLVIDGHDCSGKTTLATALARELKVPYLKPFNGQLGDDMVRAAELRDFDAAAALASRQLSECLERARSRVCVIDRHWMTVFTLLPENYWDAWRPLPPTVLCAADLKTTMRRLAARSEEVPLGAWHAGYQARYSSLADRFNVPVIDTGCGDERGSLRFLMEWAERVLEVAP